MNIEILRNKLYKSYLEDFYAFCKKLGGTTADVMCPILAVSNILVPNLQTLAEINVTINDLCCVD